MNETNSNSNLNKEKEVNKSSQDPVQEYVEYIQHSLLKGKDMNQLRKEFDSIMNEALRRNREEERKKNQQKESEIIKARETYLKSYMDYLAVLGVIDDSNEEEKNLIEHGVKNILMRAENQYRVDEKNNLLDIVAKIYGSYNI